MAQHNPKNAGRPFFEVPAHVRDPEKLQHLATVMDLDPDTLLNTVEDDYTGQQWAHPHIYQVKGPEKGGLLVMILQQCKELAEGLEEQQGATDHLSRTLNHVQAHLAVLVADYEEQLREVRGTTANATPDA